jgi:hypothetical protein
MKYTRRTFIGSAVTAAAGMGLTNPFFLLADGLTPAVSQPAGAGLEATSWQRAKGILTTPWTNQVNPDKVWPEYPRPQLARERWLNLNGLWNYRMTTKEDLNLPGDYAGKILVPFGVESPLSGVMKPLLPHQRLWYQRKVVIPADWTGQRVLLHFGAVDWEATVYIDGEKIGTHRGGYDSFSFDITRHVKAGQTHRLVVSVWDPTDAEWQLHGKQTLHPGGCSYTATSGIWQTAWLEPVPESYIETIELRPDLEKSVLKLTVVARMVPRPLKLQAIATDNGQPVADISGGIGDELTPMIQENLVNFFKATSTQVSAELEIPITKVKTWSPDSPFLYDLKVYLKDTDGSALDSVTSYFGMRSVKAGRDTQGNTRLLLNGQPILLPGALDQGFWPDGVYLAPTDEALKFDIEWAKKLGLNCVRKHVKIEPARWYYWADKLGLMVFQDMPTGNCGNPTTDLPTSPEAAEQWRTEVRRIIEDNWNHPSIVSWDLFNEAFGGFDYRGNAAWVREMDPSRLIDISSGFPWHGGGNVLDGHGGVPDKVPNYVTIISEWGTPSLGCAGHQWPHAWSYGSYDPKTGKTTDFLAFYNQHKDTAVLPDITPDAKIWLNKQVGDFYRNFLRDTKQTGRSGQFYCQLVDVETECDGLISYDRVVYKVDPEQIAAAIRANMPTLLPE